MNNRILISATGSNKGKTLITSGLLTILKSQYDVHAFKCGPDYIDPMYHEAVLGIPSNNLDPFFCDEDHLKASFLHSAGELNIIEGAMGLYDGLGASSECSAYQVAKTLDCPIALIIDCSGMGASVIAEIKGFLDMDEYKLIKGIILNHISESFYHKLKEAIEVACPVKVMGYLPRLNGISLESRHLGLKNPKENNIDDVLSVLSQTLRDTLDIEALLAIMDSASSIEAPKNFEDYIKADLSGAVIGVALDDAFNFYYKDNIDALEIAGAKIVYFSPLEDTKLPDNLTALYLGGGYPELHLEELSSNESMLKSIRDFVMHDKPVLAECGGFMYLLHDVDSVNMVGLINDSAEKKKGLVRFGYVYGQYKDYRLRGHEFHRYDVTEPGEAFSMIKASNGDEYKAIHTYKRMIAGFPHFYFLSDPEFLEVFS